MALDFRSEAYQAFLERTSRFSSYQNWAGLFPSLKHSLPLELSSHWSSCPECPLLLSSWLFIYPKFDHQKFANSGSSPSEKTSLLLLAIADFLHGTSLTSYVAGQNSYTNHLWASFSFIFFLILFPWRSTDINLTLSETRILEQEFKKMQEGFNVCSIGFLSKESTK